MPDLAFETPLKAPASPSLGRPWLTGCAVFLFSLIVLWALFTERTPHPDEDGLYNAIYMYQHCGKVTYPMQMQFDRMTVHPPTHYFVVGLLCRMGLDVFHAAGVPVVLIGFLIFIAILTSRFSAVAKVALMGGFTMAVLVYLPQTTVRPEVSILFAWFGGLVLLESARIGGWPDWRLLLGGFLAAYASGLHYWALPSLAMLPFYALCIWIWPGGAPRYRKIGVMLAGALLFLIPFLVWFVIPDFGQIVAMLKQVNATGGGTREAVQNQLAILNRAAMAQVWPSPLALIGRLLYFPIGEFRLSPILLAAPILFFYRPLRGLAMAGSVLPLFVLTLVSRKGGLFYLAPELTLYCIAAVFLISAASEKLCRWVFPRREFPRYAVVAAIGVLAGLVSLNAAPWVRSGGSLRTSVQWKTNDWDVSRLANQAVLGNDALVALNQCYAWYTSGASRVYWMVGSVDWTALEKTNPQRFDSLVLIWDPLGNQKGAVPFPSFYLDGKLQVRGFYFADRYQIDHISYAMSNVLHLTARTGVRREGFAYNRTSRMLHRYVEDPAGKWVLVTLTANLQYPRDYPESAAFLSIFWTDNQNTHPPMLYAWIMDRARWTREAQRYAALGRIRDEVYLREEAQISPDSLAGQGQDRGIQFATSNGLHTSCPN
jgi:hypothetical protein